MLADFAENINRKARHERNVFTCKDEKGPLKLNTISRKGPGETTASILLLIALKDRVHYHNINKICCEKNVMYFRLPYRK